MRYRIICLVFLGSAICPLCLAQGPTELIGLWKVNLTNTLENMDENRKVVLDSLPPGAKENLRNFLDSRTFEFKSGSDFIVSYTAKGNPKSVRGSWTYDVGKRLLVLQAEGISRECMLSWLPSNTIRLQYLNASERSLVQVLYLDKQ